MITNIFSLLDTFSSVNRASFGNGAKERGVFMFLNLPFLV